MPINEPKQSFIPKKPITGKRSIRKNSSGLFFGLSFIIFLIAVMASVGVYFYRAYTEKKVESMSISLERAKAAFEPSLIIELKRLNARIAASEQILSKHIAFSEFFEILEESTLKTIRFNSFNYVAEDDDTVSITAQGEAEGYSSIALQSDEFGDNPYVQNPIFSDLGVTSSGNVTFNLLMNMDLSYLSYKNSLKQ